MDIRDGPAVDIVCDVAMGTPFGDKEFCWAWCSETLEHLTADRQSDFVKEVIRIATFCTFTFPTPRHPTFFMDPGHHVVAADWAEICKHADVEIHDHSYKTGRRVIIVTPHGCRTRLALGGVRLLGPDGG